MSLRLTAAICLGAVAAAEAATPEPKSKTWGTPSWNNMPLEPTLAASYDPAQNCNCDPTRHFSHFAVCQLSTGPNAHVTVTHTHHKACHPLSPGYFECIEVRVLRLLAHPAPTSITHFLLLLRRITGLLRPSRSVLSPTAPPDSANGKPTVDLIATA